MSTPWAQLACGSAETVAVHVVAVPHVRQCTVGELGAAPAEVQVIEP